MKQHAFADNGPVPKFTTVREHRRRCGGMIEPGNTNPPAAQHARKRALAAFEEAGDHGLTDDELERASGLGPNTARPRRIDLLKAGAIVDSGEKRKTRRGHAATVWRIRP